MRAMLAALSTFTWTVKSSYGCSLVWPFAWTSVVVQAYKNRGESVYWQKYVWLCYSRWRCAPFQLVAIEPSWLTQTKQATKKLASSSLVSFHPCTSIYLPHGSYSSTGHADATCFFPAFLLKNLCRLTSRSKTVTGTVDHVQNA